MTRTAIPGELATRLALAAAGLLIAAQDARAQDDPPTEYRVEVLVVEPAVPRSDAWPAEALENVGIAADPALLDRLARALDPLWPRLTDAVGLPLPRPLAPRTGILPPEDDGDDAEARTSSETPEIVERAPRWLALRPPPETLLDAERRLTGDGGFRPVTRLAWIQTAGTPRRPLPVRVHDDVIIQREVLTAPDTAETTGAPALTGATSTMDRRSIDAGAAPQAPDPFDDSDIAGDPPLPPLPPVPKADPRLDGSVALVQRQFLHAEIDLHWREPVERPRQPGAPADRPSSGPATSDMRVNEPVNEPIGAPDAGWQVHRLAQSRVIRPERWTWFDSERFGVLIRVTELPPLLPPPPPPEPTEPTEPPMEPAERTRPAGDSTSTVPGTPVDG
ncbi:hypothetical protein HFP89_03055 [Wenzhouxiangella sp. XN79A]|uniref:CsiV family protein n=1 Tax=Wenzhouxiangella sp. XN79A TaxID=2724193 RepID=UPI00144ADE45|nr:CsiV family protein [Wenzhouxiangella sp. XN79A]NKI34143.1 hypothetical protein [Wenzhouxiangella sp. XN79A]